MRAGGQKAPPPLCAVGAKVDDTALPAVLEQKADAESVIKNSGPHPAAYSIAEFAAAFGLSRSHVYNLFRRGEGPVRLRAGRRVLLSRSAVSAWVSRMEALADAKSTGGGQRS